ncbi:MAG TPA: hypothetical protein DCF63_09895, partial [Planctomycetaceae bacterium]|nr:hypothetical protein [Planctomycetaceae bacterium]
MNYYPFHLGDYAAHTAHLEPMEDLAYRRLLDQYYLREGPLPSDVSATAKLVRMRSKIDDGDSVLRDFFTRTEDGWVHGRCDAEIEKMQDKQAKAKASAQASVSARKARSLNGRSTPAEHQIERTLNERSTNVDVFPRERSTQNEKKLKVVEQPTTTP